MAKNTKIVIDSLIDAVVASGKKFTEIPQNTIFGFFDKEGIPRTLWNELYEKAKSKFEPKPNQSNVKHVDYSDSSHNDVKTRQPRKSIFGEINKIAG